MPKDNKEHDAEAGSAPKARASVVKLAIIAVLVLIIGAVAFTFLSDKRLVINNQRLDVVVANTSSEREQGLSGHNRLGENQGMLFVFGDSSIYCMWMKDMKFPIDILWLDKDKKVITIHENATPESYPEETFCPEGEAQYVLEVNAGSVKKWGITQGDQATF